MINIVPRFCLHNANQVATEMCIRDSQRVVRRLEDRRAERGQTQIEQDLRQRCRHPERAGEVQAHAERRTNGLICGNKAFPSKLRICVARNKCRTEHSLGYGVNPVSYTHLSKITLPDIKRNIVKSVFFRLGVTEIQIFDM